MIALIALFSLATAASWSIGEPAPGHDSVRYATQPAGVALRIVLDPPDASIQIFEGVLGREVPSIGVADGRIIPAPGASRPLTLLLAAGATARVHTSQTSDDTLAWDDWSRAVERWFAGDSTRPLAPAPWAGERVRAQVVLRRRALGNNAVARLGALHDVMMERPLDGAWIRRSEEQAFSGSVTTTVYGPGITVLAITSPEGVLTRGTVSISLDGLPQAPVDIASTGAAPAHSRLWVPPGPHTLAVVSDSDLTFELYEARARPGLMAPLPTPTRTDGIAEAERLYLSGDAAGARARFEAWADVEGPAGELARARLVELSLADGEARDFILADHIRSAEGDEVLADAALAAADHLPASVVLAALRRANDPELGRLARWLDDLGGLRAAGVALLDEAAPAVPWGPTPALRAVREATWATRQTVVPADGDATAMPRLSERAPGVARVRVNAGESATITLPDVPEDRWPVCRIRAEGPARYSVDGSPRVAMGAGSVEEALPAGPHVIVVEAGTVTLLDVELVTGATPVYEQAWIALPARWELPDPGVPAELHIRGEGDLTLTMDDGHVVQLPSRNEDDPWPVRAGPYVTSFTLEGPPGSRAFVTIRSPRGAPRPAYTPLPPEEALVVLGELTAAIDAGSRAARLTRARVLGSLGLLTLARRDLDALLAGADPDLAEEALRVAREVAPPVPSAAAPGPVEVDAALARARATSPSVPDTAPDDPELLAALADRLSEPRLRARAAELYLEEGALAAAWETAVAAGDHGVDLRSTLVARTRWTPVSRGDAGEGLLAVPREAEDRIARSTLSAQARAQLLRAPWPAAEVLVLRGDGVYVLRPPPGDLELELYCRDEAGPGADCTVPLRVDGAARTVTVPEAVVHRLRFEARPGSTLEIGGPGEGWAVVARAHVEGILVPPHAQRLALVTTPAHPVVATVAGGGLLRVEAVSGRIEARSGVHTASVGAGELAVLPLPGSGPVTVTISGDGALLLARGELPEAVPERPPLPAPPPAPELPREAIAPLFALVSSEPQPRDVPGNTGSLLLSLRGLRDARPRIPWDAAEIELDALRAHGNTWSGGTAWLRFPALAAGLSAAGSLSWPTGWVRLTLDGAAAEPVVSSAPLAGHLGARVAVRNDVELTHDLALRLGARLAGTWASVDPGARVDPRAWSDWNSDHPAWISGEARLIARLWRDARAEVGLDARSNTGPSLDGARMWTRGDLLIGHALVLSSGATLEHRFADADRATAAWYPRVWAGGDLATWTLDRQRLSTAIRAAWTAEGFEGTFGISVLWSEGRGLADLPPGSEAFRGARERP